MAVGQRVTAKAKAMKRTFVLILAGLAAAALFAGLVHVVLVTAHVAEPAATTVYGLTPRRLWATTVALLALVGVTIGGRALRRSAGRIDPGSVRWKATAALVAGLIAVIGGGLNVAFATGGPGTGNGVVGGAAGLVLGLVAMVLGGLAISRSRRGEEEMATATETARTTQGKRSGWYAFVQGVHGVRYQVKDVDRSVAFYTTHLGFTLEHQQLPAFASVSFSDARILLSGPQASGSRPMPNGHQQEPGGWNRVVLRVNDLSAFIETLKKARIRFRNDIETGPGGKQIQIEDPDGNPIELFEPAR